MSNLIKIPAAVNAHKHDCADCHFCGAFRDLDKVGQVDVYFCPGDRSLILRDGDDGDYASFPLDIAELVSVQSPAWAMAYDLYEGRPR